MKNICSTLLVCLLALRASGQQAPALTGPASSAHSSPEQASGQPSARAKENSGRKLSPAAPQNRAAHLTPHTNQSAYQGAWSSAVTYSQSQSVLYAGAIYFSLINNNLGNNPATATSAWSFLAPGGSESPCGAATIYGPCTLTVNDLPAIPSSQITGMATVATSGSYTDLANKPTLGTAASQNTSAFDPAGAAAAITLSGLGGVTSAQAAAAAPVQTVAGRTGAITLSAGDISGLGSAATQNTSAFDPAGAAAAITLSGLGGVTSAQAAAAAPVQTVAGRTGAITLSASDIGGLGSAATQNTSAFDPAGAAAAITLSGLGGVTAAQAAAAAPVQGISVNGGSAQTGSVALTIPSAQVAANLANSGATGVTGTLPLANGGTGGTTQQSAIDALTGTQSAGKYLRSDGTHATLSQVLASDIAGLGSAATQNTSAFDPAGAAAAITLSGLGGVTSAQAAAAAPVQTVAGRTGAITLSASDIAGLGSAASQNTSAFDPAGAAAAITLSGLGGVTAAQAAAAAPVQGISVNGGSAQTGAVALTIPAAQVAANLAASGATGVTGTLPLANGGTGGSSQQAAIDALTGTQSAGKYLRSDGTHATLSTLQAGDIPVLNQNTTGNAATATNLAAGSSFYFPYQSAAGTTAFLPGNTTATDQVVVSRGDGTNRRAPSLTNTPALASDNMTFTSSVSGNSGLNLTRKLMESTSSLDFNVLPDSGTTDNTAGLGTLFSSLVSAPRNVRFPCSSSTTGYGFTWTGLLAGSNATYPGNYTFAGGTTITGDSPAAANCQFNFAAGSGITSAPLEILDFRGSTYLNLIGLRIAAGNNATHNAATPPNYNPNTLMYIGRTTTAKNGGSHVFDRVQLDSYAQSATLYQVNSENFRLTNSQVYNSGTGLAWYISKNDDLSLCPAPASNCYNPTNNPSDPLSMLSIWAWGDSIVSQGAKAIEYKANGGTGDYAFTSDYGYTNHGTWFTIDAGESSAPGSNENSMVHIADTRVETSNDFVDLKPNVSNAGGSIAYLNLTGDTLSSSGVNFVNGATNVYLDKSWIAGVNTSGAPSSLYALRNSFWYTQDANVTFNSTASADSSGNILFAAPGKKFTFGAAAADDLNFKVDSSGPYYTTSLVMTPPAVVMFRGSGNGYGSAHGPSLNIPSGSCYVGAWANQTNGDICMAAGTGLYMYDSTGRVNKFLQSSRATFADLADHTVYSQLTFAQLATPAAPTIGTSNGTGSTAYQYQVLAMTADGAHSMVSPLSASISPTNALSSTNCVQVNFSNIYGASYYRVYRTANGVNQGIVANNVYTSSITDCGATGDNSAPPTGTSGTAINALGTLNVTTINGGVYSSSGTAPTAAAGAAAGTGATVSVATNSNTNRGQFTLTLGTSPAANGVLATFTYSTTANPLFCSIDAANAAAAALTGTSTPYVSSTASTTSFIVSSNTTALPAGTYTWTYMCF